MWERGQDLLFYLRPDDQWGRSSSFKTGSRIKRRSSFGFDQIEAEDLSQILTSIDYKLFRRVPVCDSLTFILSIISTPLLSVVVLLLFLSLCQFREFCVYAQAAKLKEDETSRIEECIHLFNGITIWVVCNILREYTMLKRADIIEKFIDTARVSYVFVCECLLTCQRRICLNRPVVLWYCSYGNTLILYMDNPQQVSIAVCLCIPDGSYVCSLLPSILMSHSLLWDAQPVNNFM